MQKVPLVGQTPVDRRTARLAPGRGHDTGCYRGPACGGEHEECSRACRRISRVVASVEASALRAPRPPPTWLVPMWSASNTISTGRGAPHTARGVFPPASRARGCVPRARLRVELFEAFQPRKSVGRGCRPSQSHDYHSADPTLVPGSMVHPGRGLTGLRGPLVAVRMSHFPGDLRARIALREGVRRTPPRAFL